MVAQKPGENAESGFDASSFPIDSALLPPPCHLPKCSAMSKGPLCFHFTMVVVPHPPFLHGRGPGSFHPSIAD